MKKVVFLISAFYHYLLAESLAVILSKKGITSFSIMFESQKYRFKESNVFKKCYHLEKINDRNKEIFLNSNNFKNTINEKLNVVNEILEKFSPKNTIFITFTEYHILNYIFIKEAYVRNFNILLHEEGIGTYLVKNNYYKNMYSIILEKKIHKLLNSNDLLITSPWSKNFFDIKKDSFFHFNSIFYKKFILNEDIGILEYHNKICDYRGKISKNKLFSEEDIFLIKSYYLTKFANHKLKNFQSIIYLTHFIDRREFYNIYKKILKVLREKKLFPVIIKPHPLNDSLDKKIIYKISQELNIPIYYFEENIPGEILAFLDEEIKYIFSYFSTTSWFLKNFKEFKVFMLVDMFKNNELYISFEKLKKYIDFHKTGLLLPKNTKELYDFLTFDNSEKDLLNKNIQKASKSVSETICDIFYNDKK